MDVFYGGLEAVEGTILCYLDSFHDAGYKVFKDNAIRGGKEGEDVGDELLLFRSEVRVVQCWRSCEWSTSSAVHRGFGLLGATLASMEDVIEIPFQKWNFIDGSLSSRELVECQICQDEDEDSSMEVPCSCFDSSKVCYPSDFDDCSFVEFHYFDALSNVMNGSSSSI
ncbi:hypothetical protein AAC387_Pa03g4234 [Persea americana]